MDAELDVVPLAASGRADAPEPGLRDVLAVRFHLTSGTLAGFVVLTAVAVLVGWAFAIPTLKSVFPGFVAMKVNTAIGLLLIGLALWLHRSAHYSRGRDLALKYCAGAAAVIMFATIIQHLTGWNLRIDELLMADDPTSPVQGRMALGSAAGILLIATALLIANIPGRYGFAQSLVGGAILLATLNAVGYFFGLDAFSGVGNYSAMSVHTSLALLLASLSFLFARPEEGLMQLVIDAGPGGLVTRQLLPVVFFLPLCLAWMAWIGVRAAWYEASFAMTAFVAVTTNALSYAVWGGGYLLRGFEEKRLAAETERLQSEERLRRAVADAPVPMVIHDDADTIMHMSRGWSETSGYNLRETPTLSSWIARTDATGAADPAAYLSRMTAITEPVRAGEWHIVSKEGDDRVWDVSTTPLGTLGTTRRALVTMAVDVTDRKRAEDDLRRMNEELEQRIAARTIELTRANDSLKRQSDQLKEQATLLDLVRDGILVRDLGGTIVYWSAGATDMYGWRPEQALGAVSHRLVKAEYPRPLSEIEQQVISTGFWEGEAVHTTATGRRLFVESRWTLTRTERGTPQGFLEVNRDITARKSAEESLRDSEQRFRSVAETAIEGILSMDTAGRISYWNPGAERLFGRSKADALGQPVSVVMPGQFLSAYQSENNDPVVGTTFETAGLRRDGTQFPVELSLSVWHTTQGVRYFTAIARDITERKNAERALEAKAEELSRSNQELEQFAYVASHDLQEPLRMVSNYTQLLARRYKDRLDSDAHEFIEFAVDGAKRMQDLIHDLLQYARVGTRGKELKPTSGDRIVGDAVANLAGAIEDAGAKVEIGPLPTLVCDASQLAQVFQNLIGNAIKFRQKDTKPVVRVSATRAGSGWTIAVQDNGIGIEPKYFERIFQMFQRLHGRSDYPGTGIGLALCKKIVERHGGRIHVDSEAGRGTTFSFTIPGVAPPSTP